jgi:hypothetical protein
MLWFSLYRPPDIFKAFKASVDGSAVEAKSQAKTPRITARRWSRLFRFRTT